MGWLSDAFSGLGKALNPISAIKDLTKDVTSKPSFSGFWNSFGTADPLTHGILNAANTLGADTAGAALGAVGAKKPATYFKGLGQNPTAASEIPTLAALSYIGGEAALGSLGADAGAGAGADALDTGSVNLFADAVPGAGGDVGASALDASFLPVTGAGAADGTAALTPELQSMLGISPGGTADLLLGGGGAASPAVTAGETLGQSLAAPDVAGLAALDSSAVDTEGAVAGLTDSFGPAAASSDTSGLGGILQSVSKYGGDVASWAKANPLQAASLAMMAKNLLTPNQLPSAAKTAQGASTAAVQQAQGILASGGTTSPQWATMKGSIDSSINAQVANEIEAAKQAAANSGMGGTNSAVVQQQINKIQANAETQRQQLYSQALQGIVSQAMTELSGGDQTLTSIANMQISQSKEAQAAAALTAQLAAQLSSLTKTPATTGGP